MPDDIQPAIRVVAMPKDTNPDGDIFGGWIMSMVDIAGAVEAAAIARGRVATVAVTSFQFHQPVYVGDLISCYGYLDKLGNSSISMHVHVFAQRKAELDSVVKVTEATVVYVALDAYGKKRIIPKPE